MVHGANKSGSRKRVDTKTTSGTGHKYVEKRAGKPTSMTGGQLPGTVRGTKNDVSNVTKTQRRPNRPFGGVMNSPEMRSYYRAQARLSSE